MSGGCGLGLSSELGSEVFSSIFRVSFACKLFAQLPLAGVHQRVNDSHNEPSTNFQHAHATASRGNRVRSSFQHGSYVQGPQSNQTAGYSQSIYPSTANTNHQPQYDTPPPAQHLQPAGSTGGHACGQPGPAMGQHSCAAAAFQQ